MGRAPPGSKQAKLVRAAAPDGAIRRACAPPHFQRWPSDLHSNWNMYPPNIANKKGWAVGSHQIPGGRNAHVKLG